MDDYARLSNISLWKQEFSALYIAVSRVVRISWIWIWRIKKGKESYKIMPVKQS
jgi:hypothetical protein